MKKLVVRLHYGSRIVGTWSVGNKPLCLSVKDPDTGEIVELINADRNSLLKALQGEAEDLADDGNVERVVGDDITMPRPLIEREPGDDLTMPRPLKPKESTDDFTMPVPEADGLD